MEIGSTKANIWRIDNGIIDLSRGADTPLSINARPQQILIDANATAILVIDMPFREAKGRGIETGLTQNMSKLSFRQSAKRAEPGSVLEDPGSTAGMTRFLRKF